MNTNFLLLQDKFGVSSLRHSPPEKMAALYLQVRIISRALIFVTRSCSWSYIERLGLFLLGSSMIAQLSFARIKGIEWDWAGVIWLYSLVTYVPLDLLKFAIHYTLSGNAWDNLLDNR
ncbi:hypothetical protein HN51_028360, partial [Arachis hypogaea]